MFLVAPLRDAMDNNKLHHPTKKYIMEKVTEEGEDEA